VLGLSASQCQVDVRRGAVEPAAVLIVTAKTRAGVGLFAALESAAVFGDSAREHLARVADDYRQLTR
jgi:hypothetical protein